MVAPKGPGHLVRRLYSQGEGVPALIAIEQDATGEAQQTALAWASGIGARPRRACSRRRSREETESPTSSASRPCSAAVPRRWCRRASRRSSRPGYAPEIAYFECLHELKLIVDLMYEGGLAWMRYSISDTAEYGDLTRGPRIVGRPRASRR